MTVQLEDLVARLRLDTAGLNSGLASAQASISNAGRNITTAGRRITTGLTLPLVGVATAGLTMAASFDKTMRQVAIATDGPTKALSELAMTMGAETAFSAGEAADAMLELAKGGMTAAQIQGGALAATMKLASAGGIDLASASTYVSNAMAAFGLKAKQADAVTVALAGAANASSASVESLGQGLAQASLAARNAGLSLQETTGVLSLFDSAGLKGSDAGTSLKTMLSSLTPATEKAKNAMADLGLDFIKADGSFVSIANTAQQLRDKLGPLTEAQRAQALETIFGSDGMRAASVLMNEGAKGVEKFTKASKDQKTTTALANAAMSGLSGAVERAKGSLETAALVIGGVLAPYAEKMAGYIEKGANAFSDLPGPIQAAAVGIGALVAVIGPMLLGLGFVVTALGAISLPVVAVVAGIALLVAAFILAYQRSAQFRDIVQSSLAGVVTFVQGTLIPGVQAIATKFMELVAAVTPAVLAIVAVVRDNWPQIVAIAQQVFSTIGSIIQGAMALISRIISVTVGVVTGLWNTFGQTIMETIQRVFPAVLQIIKGVLNVIQGVVRTFTSVLKGDWSGAWNGIKQILSGVWSVMQGIVKAAVGIILGAVKGFGDVLRAAWSGIWSALKDTVSNAWNGVKDAVVKGGGKVLTYVGSLPARIIHAIGDLAGKLLTLGLNIMEGLLQGIKDGAGAVLDFVGDLAGDIAGAIANPLSIFSPSRVTRYQGQMIALGLQLGIADGKAKVVAEARGISEEAAQKMIDAAKEKQAAIRAVGRIFGDQFVKGVDGSRAGVLEKFDTLLEQIKVLHIKQLTEIVTVTRNGLSRLGAEWDKAHERTKKARDNLKALVDEANGYAQSVRDQFASLGDVTSFQGAQDADGNQLPVTVADIEAGLEAAVAQADAFQAAIDGLRAAHLNEGTLQDLIARGPAEGLAAAQAILAGGQAAVDRIDALQKRLRTTGDTVAADARQSMYGAGIQAAQGLIDGLENAEDKIARKMRQIARSMIRVLNEELGIRSPSTVFQASGTYSGQGLIKGLDGMQGKVAAAAQRMSAATLVAPPRIPVAGGVGASGGVGAVNVRVFVGDREITDIVRTEVGSTMEPLARLTQQGAF